MCCKPTSLPRCGSLRTLFLAEGLSLRGSSMKLWITRLNEPTESRMDVRRNARLTAHCRADCQSIDDCSPGAEKRLTGSQQVTSGPIAARDWDG